MSPARITRDPGRIGGTEQGLSLMFPHPGVKGGPRPVRTVTSGPTTPAALVHTSSPPGRDDGEEAGGRLEQDRVDGDAITAELASQCLDKPTGNRDGCGAVRSEDPMGSHLH